MKLELLPLATAAQDPRRHNIRRGGTVASRALARLLLLPAPPTPALADIVYPVLDDRVGTDRVDSLHGLEVPLGSGEKRKLQLALRHEYDKLLCVGAKSLATTCGANIELDVDSDTKNIVARRVGRKVRVRPGPNLAPIIEDRARARNAADVLRGVVSVS